MARNGVLILLVLVVAGAVGYAVYSEHTNERSAYIVSQQVFEKFKGKAYLEQQVIQLKGENKRRLDSLVLLIESSNNAPSLIQAYRQTASSFELKEQELSDKYTAEIWKNINTYVAEFGKKKGYDFIFGATGDGSLMYADTTHNITNEVVVFINDKYDGK